MKLKDSFITHMDGDTQMIVDTSAKFSGLIRNNKTAAYIIELLKTDTTEEKFVEAVCKKYDAPKETVRKDVHKLIEEWRTIGAIDE